MSTSKQLLIVDDDQEIRELLNEYLTRAGFQVLTAAEGNEMRQQLALHSPDLIILDIMMPGDDGFTLCQQIRRDSQVPIIMLTAASDEAARLFFFLRLAEFGTAQQPGVVLDRDTISDATRGRESLPMERGIDVQISRLRQKLGDNGKSPRIIKTIRGSGYMLIAEVHEIP